MNGNVIPNKQSEAGRVLRFMAVGASGTLVDFVVLMLLKEVFLLPTLLANTLSFSVGMVNNFTWNRLWTFADTSHENVARQFLQFAAVSLVGLLLNTLIVLLLEDPFSALIATYGYIPAKVIATGVVFVWNFVANRYWTFNSAVRRS